VLLPASMDQHLSVGRRGALASFSDRGHFAFADRAGSWHFLCVTAVPVPFEIVEPTSGETPVVVEVPHAGVWMDGESMGYTVAPARCIGRDADLYVDALFEDAPMEGASLLVARLSRFVVDLNRSDDQVDRDTAEGGGSEPQPRGVVWRLSTEGDPVIRRPLPRVELARRLDTIYRPYHAALARLLRQKRERFGHAVLLCAHSMPAFARRGHPDPRTMRADVVPGTNGRTTAAPAFIDAVDRHARAHGFTVEHDQPYRGGYSTRHYGRPSEGLHAIQVEISRRLYMNEDTLARLPAGFESVRQFARSLVARLGATQPAVHPRSPGDEERSGARSSSARPAGGPSEPAS
jgi:N-formylglutamate deformylase